MQEGWGIFLTRECAMRLHYFKDGRSLCGRIEGEPGIWYENFVEMPEMQELFRCLRCAHLLAEAERAERGRSTRAAATSKAPARTH